MDTDRNLLFGVLALQADVITAAQFIDACTLWASRKDVPMADLLAELFGLSPNERADVERLVARKLHKHGGNARASLAEAAPEPVRRSLAGLNDPEFLRSLAEATPANGAVLGTTLAYQPQGRDRYLLTRLHAQGGIGQVWLAHDTDLGRDVALKELRPERQESPAVRARFLEEGCVTGQLEHPGIVPVYELARDPEGGQPFYTMRFIRGRTLYEAARNYHQMQVAGKAGPLELRELLTAFVAVCNAVAFAHARGVIHRDLKPHNVILGDFGEVMVIDWGLAKRIDRTEAGADEAANDEMPPGRTVHGQVLGTPAYMAPEQAEGRVDEIDLLSDVYGLGAVLYELLTGQPPFQDDDTPAVLRRVIHEAPVPPRKLVPATPAPLQAVCLKALAKRREDRYASASDLARDVARFLADEPVAACPDPLPVRLARWGRHHRTLLTVAAVMLVTAVLGLGAGTLLLGRPNRLVEEQRDEARQQRDRAETNFQLARQAVDGLTRVSENPDLKALALEPLRHDLLGQAKDFYEQLAHQQASEPRLQAERGRAYLRLADITEAMDDRREAISLAQQARAIFQQLSELDRSAADYRDGLARALTTEGHNYYESERLQEARPILERAVSTREQPRTAQPDVRQHRYHLAVALNDLGLLYLKLGLLADGTAKYAEARALCEQLTDESPDEPDYRSELARTQINLSTLSDFDHNLPKAIVAANKAADLLQKLVDDHPGNPEYQSRLTTTLHVLCMAHPNLRQAPEARSLAARGVAVADRLVRAHPDLSEYRKQLSVARVDYGIGLAQLGDHARSAAEIEAAVSKESSGLALNNAACAYCHCALAVGRDARIDSAERDKLAAKYFDRAMSLLLAAEKKDLFEEAQGVTGLRTDDDLNPLRQRADFKQLLTRVKNPNGAAK
jgi:serine/threonine-protein kinase